MDPLERPVNRGNLKHYLGIASDKILKAQEQRQYFAEALKESLEYVCSFAGALMSSEDEVHAFADRHIDPLWDTYDELDRSMRKMAALHDKLVELSNRV